MSFLKQILSPFVEFEDDKKNESSKENKTPVGQKNNNDGNPTLSSPAAVPGFNTNAPSPGTAGASVLPEHQKYFESLIEEVNAKSPLFQGTDYKEFIDSKTDIDAITDEPTRYKTAYNVLKRTGLTKEKLISTGQEYINIIGRELNNFQSAYMQQYQKEVKQKEQLIQKKAEEMQALNQRIAALNAEMKQLSGEITQSKDKLDANRNSFISAGESKQREIQTELQKIAQYF